jgi:hypothetical protein
MLSTVKAKPNYYELLGLSPAASNSEIAQAFAREAGMFRPRAFGAAAEVCLAYAILNDPAKRRAYDDSMGLTAEPEASRPALTEIKIGYRQEWAAPFVAARQQVSVADDARTTAASPPVSPAQTAHRAPAAPISIKEQVEQVLAQRGSASAAAPEPVEWAKPGLTIGALLLAAAVVGVYVGLSSAEPVEPELADPAAPVGSSTLKPEPASAVETPLAVTAPTVVDPEPRMETTKRIVSSPEPVEALPAVPADSITESIEVVRVPAADTPSEDRATQQAAVAALPISNTAIARTIERIGYACGSVDSTAPVDGAGAGIFKVSCTSGDAYRAAPIRGRYHFRRWDRR